MFCGVLHDVLFGAVVHDADAHLVPAGYRESGNADIVKFGTEPFFRLQAQVVLPHGRLLPFHPITPIAQYPPPPWFYAYGSAEILGSGARRHELRHTLG